jgi:hypothetical protein
VDLLALGRIGLGGTVGDQLRVPLVLISSLLAVGSVPRPLLNAVIGSPTGTDIVEAYMPWYLRLWTWSNQAACSNRTRFSLMPILARSAW